MWVSVKVVTSTFEVLISYERPKLIKCVGLLQLTVNLFFYFQNQLFNSIFSICENLKTRSKSCIPIFFFNVLFCLNISKLFAYLARKFEF